MKVPNTRDDATPELQMTPMIDVVFLLLVFFIWTSSFEQPEFDLPSSLAETPAGGALENEQDNQPVEAYDEIVVKLFMIESITYMELNGERLESVDALRSKLAEVIRLGVQPPVIVDPDELIRMEDAIAVYDAARAAGADRVLFAAHP